jgi:glycine/D-amino acid oxidase-like deaminating enzyme
MLAVTPGPSGEDEMTASYDAIVVGARCAGSPTAMLLARRGYRVLLVDRAGFPSDTLSLAGTVSPVAFFARGNIQRAMTTAAAA